MKEIQHPHLVSGTLQQVSGVPEQFSFGVCHHKRGVRLHQVRLGIKAGLACTRTADHKGVEVSAVAVGVIPDGDVLCQNLVALRWFLPVLPVNVRNLPPPGGTVFLPPAVVRLGVMTNENHQTVNGKQNQCGGKRRPTERQTEGM